MHLALAHFFAPSEQALSQQLSPPFPLALPRPLSLTLFTSPLFPPLSPHSLSKPSFLSSHISRPPVSLTVSFLLPQQPTGQPVSSTPSCAPDQKAPPVSLNCLIPRREFQTSQVESSLVLGPEFHFNVPMLLLH